MKKKSTKEKEKNFQLHEEICLKKDWVKQTFKELKQWF